VKTTLHKYIFNEIWPTFLTALMVFGIVVVGARMLSVSEWVINRGVPPGLVLKFVFYLLPDIILFAMPAVCLMAVFVAFLRLSSDNEILAMKSSGISLYQMLPSVFFVSLTSCLIAGFLGIFGSPWGNRSFKDLVFEIAQSKPDLGIRERIFCEPFDNIMFYVSSFSTKDRAMRDVFVVDSRDPSVSNTIVAKEAKILSHPKSRIISIGFLDGTVLMVDRDFEASRTMKFKSYDLNIGLKDIIHAVSSRRKSPKEMPIQELIRELNTPPKEEVRHNEMIIEFYEKFSIPLAVFFMGIIGVPLGAQIRSKERSFGIVFSLAIFLIYYLVLAGVRSLCESATLPPAMGVWLPDFLLFILCFYLMARAANERPLNILERFSRRWNDRKALSSELR
jgi:lipopolysaccharide export system permease protein